MRLVFIASGKSIHSFKWVSSFTDKHKVIWVSTSGFDPAFDKKKDIEYLNYCFTKSNFLNSVIGFFKVIFDVKQADIVHLHYVGFHALITLLIRRRFTVVTAWGSDIVFAMKSKIKTLFLINYLRRANLITCDSGHMKRAILSLSDCVPIEIINFGIDTNKFKKSDTDTELKKELGLCSDNIIISTRNHEPVYDISTIIKSARSVVDTFPDAIFIVAGSGSTTPELQQEVERLSLTKNIIFVGSLSNTDILRYLSISTVYVSSSLSDGGIAASTAEAMSAEIPCVITDVVDNSDWVQDGSTGMLFEAKNAKELSDKIVSLLENKDIRVKIGKRARKLIRERNDIHCEMEKMNSIYETLL